MDKIAIVMTNLRKEKGWSQAVLANQSRVSREMISKYERGIAIPSVNAAKKIADAFEVSLDYLYGEGQNVSFDKKIVERIKDLQLLEPDKRKTLFDLIDTYIRDFKTRQAYTS